MTFCVDGEVNVLSGMRQVVATRNGALQYELGAHNLAEQVM
jgi:hypothetical protein